MELKSEPSAELLSAIEYSLIVYQSLFMQAGINEEKTQSALVLDANLPESQIALQILTRTVKVVTLAYTLDQFDNKTVLKEGFPSSHMIFTPTEKLLNKATEISCGLGFDLILDYGGEFSANKRTILKLCGPFARIITTAKDLQIDPPETELL